MFLHGQKIHITRTSVIHMASYNLRLITEQFKQKSQTIKVLSVLSSNVINSDCLSFHWPVNDILKSGIAVCVYYKITVFVAMCFSQCFLFLFIITLFFLQMCIFVTYMYIKLKSWLPWEYWTTVSVELILRLSLFVNACCSKRVFLRLRIEGIYTRWYVLELPRYKTKDVSESSRKAYAGESLNLQIQEERN